MRRLILIMAALAFAPGGARGADFFVRGIDPVGNKPAATHEAFLTVEGMQTAPARSYRLAFGLDLNLGLMGLSIGDEKVDNLLRSRLDLHLLGAWSPLDGLELGVDLPATAYQGNGFDALESQTGFSDTEPAAAGLGDVRLLGKLRLFAAEQGLTRVGLLAEARLPTGDGSSFLGERGAVLSPHLIAERTFFSKLRAALDAGYRYRTSPGQYLNLYVGDELLLGLAGSWALPPKPFSRWAVHGEILAATPSRAPFTFERADALKTALELLLGLRANLTPTFVGTLAIGRGVAWTPGFGREGFRVMALIAYEKPFNDRDGDGIRDDEDKCPDQPEDKDGFEDSDGCPDPDNDKDGIPDVEDKCPNVPGLKEFEGCPDTDKDGIADDKDRCPKEPGPKEYDGCPDRDGDEIPDPDDKCPDVYGTAKADGCPPEGPQITFENGNLVLKSTVTFDTGKATIKKESFPLLDEAATLLKGHPELKKLKVEGHTDNVGPDNFNLDLSKRRAQSVVDYLVNKGIARDRLVSEGFGESRPVAPNETALGRAKNRRVDFTVVE